MVFLNKRRKLNSWIMTTSMMVGFGVYTSVRFLANPSIKIEDDLHPVMGVSAFLILGWGPKNPTLSPGTP